MKRVGTTERSEIVKRSERVGRRAILALYYITSTMTFSLAIKSSLIFLLSSSEPAILASSSLTFSVRLSFSDLKESKRQESHSGE